MKTALVTGGAGFIGSHLCERLQQEGYKVISLDNYFTGLKENHVEGVDYREGHTRDVKRLVPEEIDLIFHLGEYSRVAKSMDEPQVVWDLNMSGTFGVLEFWRERKCKLVYAGSSTKFSSRPEDGIEGQDLSPYTWTKAANSSLVANYGRWFTLPFASVYFYNVYGPRELSGEYGTVIEIFRQKYLRGEPLQVRSPGTQQRIYTHVKDTIEGIMLVGNKGEGDGYGIAASEKYSILEVAHMFGGEIDMLPARSTSRPTAVTDTSKTEGLGWKQKFTLADYIEQVKKEKS